MTPEDIAGLNVAVNEALFQGLAVSLAPPEASVTLSPPGLGPTGDDSVLRMRLFPLRRLSAALVSDGSIQHLGLDDLLHVAHTFGGRAIYGWEFFDGPATDLADTITLDIRLSDEGAAHVFHFVQEDISRLLSVWLYFDQVEFSTRSGEAVAIGDVIKTGRQFWDASKAGDESTFRSGIVRLNR